MNRTLLEKVRCMLSNAGLGKQFWAEAVMYASHLINRLPSAALNGKTPLEVWSGKPINDYDTLHVFGSTAYYHVKESKLDPRAKKALFMGVTSGVKGYRLWCLSSKKIISSRDVTFDEFSMLKKVTTDGKVSENTFQQPEEDCRRWRVLRNWWSFRRLQLNQLKTSRQNMKQKLERKRFQTKNLSSNMIYQLPSAGQEERLGNLLGLKIWWLMHFQW